MEIELDKVATVEDVKKLFADTVFWNWLAPVDEGLIDPQHADSEYPLKIHETSPDEDGWRDLVMTFESGECSIKVATVPNNPNIDAESTATEADARFIASLPASIPILLREIAFLQKAHSLLVEIYQQIGNHAPAERRHAVTPGLRDSIRDHIWIDCPICFGDKTHQSTGEEEIHRCPKCNGSGKALRKPIPA